MDQGIMVSSLLTKKVEEDLHTKPGGEGITTMKITNPDTEKMG